MINYTKKWWLLGCLRRAEKIHSTRGSNTGDRVLISQAFFIKGDTEWPGLAHKYNPYVRFRLSRLIFWKKEYDEFKIKEKINEYNDIYEVCFQEGYIGKDQHTNFPSVSTSSAYRIRGFPLGYFQGLFSEYEKVTTTLITIIGLIISFLVGTFVGR